MNTYTATLTPTWQEVLGGSASLFIDGKSAKSFELHFNQSPTAPDSDAPFVSVQTHPAGFDFEGSGYAIGQYVWARVASDQSEVVIVR